MGKLVKAKLETAAGEQDDLLTLIMRTLQVKLRKTLPDLYSGFSVQRPTPGKVMSLVSFLKSAGYESDLKSFQAVAASAEAKPRIGYYRIDSRVSDMTRATIGIDMYSGVVTVKLMS